MGDNRGVDVREAVRGLLVDPGGAVFLMGVVEPLSRRAFWITPGGGIDDGEDQLTALRRELGEELGLDLPADRIGAALWRRRVMLSWNGLDVEQHETFYLIETERFEPTLCRDGDQDTEWVEAVPRWWTEDDLRASDEHIAPVNLADLLADLRRDGAPAHPVDISV